MSNAKFRKPAGDPKPETRVPEALLGQGLKENPAPLADPDDPMPDTLARRLLANAAMLMNHIANLCGHAMDAIPEGTADRKFAVEVIEEAQQIADGKEGRIKRAQPHALTNLMRIAISASRLMETMLHATNPGLFAQKPDTTKKAFDAQKQAQEMAENIETSFAT
ncbi:MAG: hypothetical protein KDB82_18335 [Planctomycetes bacterium]|nr:hypothetical protein [Planctomycetota bacterium]